MKNILPLGDIVARLAGGDKDAVLLSLALCDLPSERASFGGVMTHQEVEARYCDLVARARALVISQAMPSAFVAPGSLAVTTLEPFRPLPDITEEPETADIRDWQPAATAVPAPLDTGELSFVAPPVVPITPISPVTSDVPTEDASESSTSGGVWKSFLGIDESDTALVPEPLPAPAETVPGDDAPPLVPAVLKQKLDSVVAAALKQEIVAAGLTQTYIAEHLGFEQWQVGQMLSGKINAPITFAEDVRRAIEEASGVASDVSPPSPVSPSSPTPPPVSAVSADRPAVEEAAPPHTDAPAAPDGMTSEEFRNKLEAAVAAGEETFKPKRFDVLCELATLNFFPVERHQTQAGCVCIARCERKGNGYVTSLEARGIAKIPGGTDK